MLQKKVESPSFFATCNNGRMCFTASQRSQFLAASGTTGGLELLSRDAYLTFWARLNSRDQHSQSQSESQTTSPLISLSIGDISKQRETLVSHHVVIADYQAFGIFEQCYPSSEVNVGVPCPSFRHPILSPNYPYIRRRNFSSTTLQSQKSIFI